MHSTSLIGQALGGATGTKASTASDTSQDRSKVIAAKSSKERPFADYVEGASSKAETVSAPTQDKLAQEKPESGAVKQVAADTPASDGEVVAGQNQAAPEETQIAQAGDAELTEAEIAEAEFSGADGLAADAPLRSSRTSGESSGTTQSAAQPIQDTPSSKLASKEGALPTGKELPSDAGTSQSSDTEADASMRERQAQPGAAAGKETLASQAPERIGAGDKTVAQSEASVDRKAEMPASAQTGQSRPDGQTARTATETTARSAPEATARTATEATARSGSEGAARAAAPQSEAQVKAQAASNAGQVKPGQGAATAEAAVTAEAESLRAAGEKPSDARATAAPSTAANTTQSASQSVFQMQVQNAETGEARKSRYRIRDGAAQPVAEVKNATPAKTATFSAAPTIGAAISLSQPVQSVTAKFSQNPSLIADSVAGQASLTADLPGLPQLLTEAVFQPGATHRVEMPRMIATQLAEAFAAKGERNMDVSLNPEELGRVKMRVSTSDTGIVMTIQTERPETGDLMRRHINELAEEFRRMGFQDISFEFSSGESFGGQAEQGLGGDGGGTLGGTAEMAASEVAADSEKQNLQLGSSGMDMRV
ncbi:flagellar hook-length control protein FliK [Phaeobacter sp. QD34_3]|uniref:flagellar hook-length control protein FliK n=1 Tax=unclassified Phaeobacter TaxID=2621772 RepID=UPI00237FA9B6|nr:MULTISPECIES: flagellar hook-length control protein FliK [unclassified Phaeobacter]MDE4134557.1 flagellar hook-length control protein FliK [Phaeobacter sp. QD34_3]MDE4138216.1 flagellar hook-length control protein FliK [Phaeobacter sp. QD34_24]